MTIAIVAAMPEELAPLRARLVAPSRAQRGTVTVERGRLAGREVALCATGDGARNARSGVAELLGTSSPEALLVLGVSGALSPELATGDLIVASRVTDEEGTAREADPAWVDAAARATGGRPAVVMSARRIADSAGEKRRLAARRVRGWRSSISSRPPTWPPPGPGRSPGWSCARSAIAPTRSLPALLNRSIDGGGAVNRGRVLAACSAIRRLAAPLGAAQAGRPVRRGAGARRRGRPARLRPRGRCRVKEDGGILDALAGRAGEKFALHEQYLNPKMVQVLKTIGFDRHYLRAEGAYLYDREGQRYLDFLSGFGVFAIGRNHPTVKRALADVLAADLADLVQMDVSPLAGMLAEKLIARMPGQGAASSSATRGPRRSRRPSSWRARPPAAPSWSTATTPSTG